ncbi:MAG: hypothetical protein ACXAEX_01420, partial [Promethearchaeota archaeon]
SLQYARGLGKTQVGNRRERVMSPDSRKIIRLNKENMQLTNEEAIKLKAQKEVSRILEYLDIPNSFVKHIMGRFNIVRAKLKPGSKFRNPEKLAAILTYLGLKVENVAVNKTKFIKVAGIEEKEFNSFILQAVRYIRDYAPRNRQDLISKKLLNVTMHFGLDMGFYFLSRNILYKLWDNIKNTTDNVVTGLCTSITALCNYKNDVKINAICELLGIKMSTIQFQVKKRIFERFKLQGFSTLVRSAELLKGFIKKIGLIEDNNPSLEVKSEDNGIIEVKLGNACQVFNTSNEYYLFGTTDEISNITLAYLEVHNTPNRIKFIRGSRKNADKWFNLTLGEYFPYKGPPPSHLFYDSTPM